MPVSAYDVLVYLLAALLVGGAVWWATARWVPDGALSSFRFHAYQSGVARRHVVSVVALGALAFLPVIRHGVDSVGFAWALLTALYGAGLALGAIGVANRPRAALLDAAVGPETLPQSGPCAVAGQARPTDEGRTLEAPVTEREAVCYTAWVAQYRERPLRDAGTYFTTDDAMDRTRFAVDGYGDHVVVDPEDAWLSLAAGSPTNREVSFEGATTCGLAEREVVVEEGERVPDRLRGEEGPFERPLPVDADGRAERSLRFKEDAVEPGEAVVAVGEARTGASFGETLLACDRDAAFVARGEFDHVAASLRYATGRALSIAAGLALVGATGLLWLTL